MDRIDLRLWKRFLAIAKPYWKSEEKGTAWALLAVLILLLVGYTGSNVLFNRQTGEFYSALASRNGSRFWHTVRVFLVLLIIAVPINAYYYYVRDRLAIQWRRWLTDRIVTRYLRHRAFYRLVANSEIDNPDQRIQEDVSAFTQQSLNFLLLFASATFELVAFSGVLWSISKLLVLVLLIYAGVGTLVTVGFFSGRMIQLYFEKLKREANFRFGLVRIRENAESIAFYRGEREEQHQVRERFARLFENFIRLIRWSLGLNFFSYSYTFMTLLLPGLIIAPRVLSGELEVGRVVQAEGAFTAVLTALSIIVNNLEDLSHFAAGVGRLDTFVASLGAPVHRDPKHPEREASQIQTREEDQLAFDDVNLQTPNYERTLIKNLSLQVAPGESLLITGESGSGKSSLLRAVAGLWDSGSGTLVRPKLADVLFLPQHAYTILGSVRQQLCYPHPERGVPDDELLKILHTVNLPELVDRSGGLDAVIDFEKVLSMGERQRLAFARILVNRPRWVLLDEATSSLDPENEAALYLLLAPLSMTVVSVSHHPSLLKYHSQVLELTGNGKWKLSSSRGGASKLHRIRA